MRVAAPPRRWPASVQPVVLAALLAWLLVALVVALGLERDRAQSLRQAQREAETLATVLEESTAHAFDSVDLALQGVADLLARDAYPRNDAALRQLMRERLKYLPTVRALFVIGPDGHVQHDTDYPRTPDVSLADRAYFREYVQKPDLQHSLSEALQSRSGLGWFVASTRRITGPGGEFRGVVVAAVQLDMVSRLFDRLDLGAGQVIWLLQADGHLLARFPPDDASIGRSYSQLPVFAERLPRQRTGSFFISGPPLGYPRIVSYRALASQPLVVVLTTAESQVLAAWRRTVSSALAGLLVLTLLAIGAVLAFAQRQRHRAQALALQAAEQEARAHAELNARFRAFFEQGRFLSCVLALDGTVVEANNAGLQAGGYTRGQVIGRLFWECGWWRGSGPRVQAIARGFAEAAAGGAFRGEAACSLADGRQSLVELVLSPVRDEAGLVLAVAAVGVDIAERKHIEEQLRTLAEDLRNADRLKGEFLATLSHELRNVLAPLQNGMAILERVDPLAPQATQARGLVQRQLQQLRALVDDLLDVARVNSGKIRLERQRLDLRQLLASAAESAQAFVEGPGHRLETLLPDEALPVDVDRTRLLQVLANLLSNAAKYTPPGGHVLLRARREGHEAVVEVVDDGIGIPAAAQAKVFEMFEQVSGHLSRAQGGLGIGLALVQKLVALHGGHVEAFSDGPNLGSTFTVYLPLAQEAQLPSQSPGICGTGH